IIAKRTVTGASRAVGPSGVRAMVRIVVQKDPPSWGKTGGLGIVPARIRVLRVWHSLEESNPRLPGWSRARYHYTKAIRYYDFLFRRTDIRSREALSRRPGHCGPGCGGRAWRGPRPPSPGWCVSRSEERRV